MRRPFGRLHGLCSPKLYRLFELHEGGVSVHKIADELRMSPSVVRKALQAHQVQEALKMARTSAQRGAQ